MSFVDQFNKGMQRVMAMRTPEILALIPRVEAMSYDARVRMVTRGRDNLASILKGWNKFAPIMTAQGVDRAEIRRRLKGLRSAKNHLDDALRLSDPKLPPAFKPQAEAAFNVLAACFLRDAGFLDAILTGPRLDAPAIMDVVLPAFDRAPASMAVAMEPGLPEAVTHDVSVDGPSRTRTEPEGEVVDVITEAGGDRVVE